MERIVKFYPAWDKRDQNYGVHGVEMKCVLKGDKGAVQFLLFTNWMLPPLRPKWDERQKAMFLLPMPADLGYHSPTPHYEDQAIMSESCEWLDGKPCYYDGSGLNAEPIFETLVAEGDEAMWKAMQEYYDRVFGEEQP